jgi:penicillin-binding protein 2
VEISEASPQFSHTDIVRSAIGQATHAYTPAQLSRYVTTVANNGTCYDLTLIDKIKDVDGKVVLNNKAKVRNKVTLAASTWKSIHEGMYLVTNGSGSSTATMFAGLKKKVAGKTGTAQLNSYHANHAEFISYAPYEKPEISVTCVIPNGYASSNAAQTARDVYKYYFSKGKKKVSGKVKMPESAQNHID